MSSVRRPMCDEAAERSLASVLLVLAGSIISAISVLNNCLIFYCLYRSPRRTQCYFQFLLILSLFDIIISLCYMPVILVDSLKDWLSSVALAGLWWSYFVYMLAITHISMTASSFVLVGALFERYLITVRSYYLKQFQSTRTMFCVSAIMVSVFTKGGIVLELDIFPSEDIKCLNTINEFYVDVTNITTTLWYGNIYRFWLRNMVTVFLPFALLTLINVGTLYELKNQLRGFQRTRAKSRFHHRIENKTKVRSATWTLLMVCGVYLLANVPNIVVTAWEFVDMNSLQTDFFDLYMFSTDLVSLLAVSACALRLPIYMICNPELRRVVLRTLQSSFGSMRQETCKKSQFV